ncbi:phage tail protein [Mesorhizobium sp. Root102]|uniref:phage tail protein n=1 Tax=Mesorhizobium sp. Root102 TaxID=1736422 RepID=UPI0006F6A729|nr:tail fiber protein [Mesorhizobium sp. Root102]KQU78745.1 phage tail protein [Mesorhizobium sp. Root102]
MSTPYVGEIRMFGFSRVPYGWFACDGSLQSIAQYEVLYTLIGTTYGGDGQSTFAMPNLSGRVPMHWGTGPGLSSHVIGELSGTETVTLLPTQMPQHNHPMVATTVAANARSVGATVELGALVGDTMYATDVSGANGFITAIPSTQPVGGNTPHDNTMPTLTVQFCIAWSGIFPSQS